MARAAEVLEGIRLAAKGSAASGFLRVATGSVDEPRGLKPPRPTGLAALDQALGGGLPRGRLVELVGPASSGRMSIVIAALAAASARGEVVAIVDAADAFDPVSAAAAGVDLPRLLWVRPASLVDSLRAADLVLDAGGFGVVVLYLCGASLVVRKPWRGREPDQGQGTMTDAAWARLARTAERAGSGVLVVADRRLCGTFAAATVETTPEAATWRRSPAASALLAARVLSIVVARSKLGPPRERQAIELGPPRRSVAREERRAPKTLPSPEPARTQEPGPVARNFGGLTQSGPPAERDLEALARYLGPRASRR